MPFSHKIILLYEALLIGFNRQTGHEIRKDGHLQHPRPCPHPDCRRTFSSAKNLELHLASGAHDNACLVCDREGRKAVQFS